MLSLFASLLSVATAYHAVYHASDRADAPSAASPPPAAPRRAQVTTGGGWASQHHDLQNSGATTEVGPGAAAGDCRVSFFDIKADTAVRFYSSGFTSAATVSATAKNTHFFGGTDNVVRVVIKTGAYVNESACALAPLVPGTQNATPWGLIATGVGWTALDGTPRVALPSADGAVYALAWENCISDTTKCNTTDLKVQTGNDEVSVGAARGVRGGAAAGACVAWFFVSPKGFPFLAPATHVPLGCFGCPSGGVVLVADTHPTLFTMGTVYALQQETGAHVWNVPLINNGSWYGAEGIAPAYDPLIGVLFFPAGPGVLAVRAKDGVVVGRWQGAGDRVVASPSLLGGSEPAMFLHSDLGTLWRLDYTCVSRDTYSIATNVSFTARWKCDHTLARYWGTDKTAACVAAPTAAAEEAVAAPLLGAGGGATANARRGDFGGAGGWPQPSTAAAVAALAAATRARFAAAFPQRAGASLVEARHSAALSAGTVEATPDLLAALEASLMYAALPAEHVAALESGGDWAGSEDPFVASYKRLDGRGRPLSAALGAAPAPTYTSTYPRSTPTQLNGGGELAVAQFAPLGASAAGLFVVSAKDGKAVWAYANQTIFTTIVNFGRSRSSPTVDGDGNLYGAWSAPRHAMSPPPHAVSPSLSPPSPKICSGLRRGLVQQRYPPVRAGLFPAGCGLCFQVGGANGAGAGERAGLREPRGARRPA